MIRIFIGCAANHEDAESQAVLEYTLRKHASLPLDITWMKLSRDRNSPWFSDKGEGWRTDAWATPFSGFRWAIPEICGFQGRAIYSDSDCIVQADIAELWNQKFKPGKVVMAKGGQESWRYCVSMWDCAAVKTHMMPLARLRSAVSAHQTMIRFFKGSHDLVQAFSGNWNCIDGENYARLDDPDIKVIHYSSEAHQPQLKFAVPRLRALGRRHWFDGEIKQHWRSDMLALFFSKLKEAEAVGYPVDRYTSDPIYGPYIKASQKNYQSHKWAR